MNLIKEFVQNYLKSNKKIRQFHIHSNKQNNISHIGKFLYFDVTMCSIEKENIPHFHLIDLNTNEEIHIQILKPKYYKYDRLLSNEEIDNLIYWLNSPAYDDSPDYSQYEYICWNWGTNNFQSPIKSSHKMPDFNLLKI